MAFKNIKKERAPVVFFNLKEELSVGDSMEGYLLNIENSRNYPGRFNLVMKVEGEEDNVVISAIGNIHYMVKDGVFTPGAKTRITREADKKTKNKEGKSSKSTQFLVEQDTEDLIEVGEQDELDFAATASREEEEGEQGDQKESLADKLKKLKGKK